MAEISTVARPYAEALFEAASKDKESAGAESWSELLSRWAQIVALPDVREALSDPRLGDEQSITLFAQLTQVELSPSARNFITLLVENGRLLLLPEIARQFAELKNRSEGAAVAEIVSAFPLEGVELADLVAALEKRFGLKLKPQVTVDASLIGGVRVAVGDQVLDTSVLARLAQMRNTLAA